MRIGIFDSGRGGEFVAADLRLLLPEHEYIVVNDREHVPYGSRTDDDIIALTTIAIQPLILDHCPVIIIACNTATMAAISSLRLRYPSITFIGIEPMVKPAGALSKSGHITVLATPLTLRSKRYRQLKKLFAHQLHIDEPDTSGWAAAIETHEPDTIDLSVVTSSVSQGSDTVVLACTHYHTLVERLRASLPNSVNILEPTPAIARQLSRVVTELRAQRGDEV